MSRRSYNPKRNKRQTTANRIAGRYQHKAWTKYRKSYIMANPLCAVCGADATGKWKGNVDHIIRTEDGGAWYSPANTQTLCTQCHGIKSRMEGRTGSSLVEWTYDETGEKIPKDKEEIVRLLRGRVSGQAGAPL